MNSGGSQTRSSLISTPYNVSLFTISERGKKMIRFFLLQNKQGKTRLSKWYATAPEDSERIKMEADIHRIVALRIRGNTNFIEVLRRRLKFSMPCISMSWALSNELRRIFKSCSSLSCFSSNLFYSLTLSSSIETSR